MLRERTCREGRLPSGAPLGSGFRSATPGRVAALAPTKLRRDMAQHTLHDVGVEVDAELVWNREEQGVRGFDRLVFGKFLHELIRLPGVRLAKSGQAPVQVADLVLATGLVTEVRIVEVVDDREDAAAHGDSRLTLVAGCLPGVVEPLDLFGLELMERHSGVLGKQCRTHQIHALLAGPLRGPTGAGSPPNPVAQ